MMENSAQNIQDDIIAYLIHSYLYYIMNTPVISDSEYDKLCKRLLDSGAEHELISREDLAAGTGYSIKEYPADIIAEARKLASEAPIGTPAVGEDRRSKKFEFNYTPMETYLLMGMYIDYGYANFRDKQAEVGAELRKRWDQDMHRDEFEAYFKSWGFGPERFGLNGKIS
ncbi:MAG: hypothetical protein AMJ56_07595 [Anaerolineae bacterium SG8_19]|nr:MAG: hypothetical protein AMJ56_07595 [Anaerolineae bacterium SG8_19]